ncbi:MAG TPA: Ig domain-containing protein, partial [Terriglobales bacterium]|nr:Ig domain-containing protein [Terriglobales bacterium]
QFSFVVQVVDSASPQQKASANLSLTIASAPPPSAISIITTSLPAGEVSAGYLATLAASGGTSPYAWSVTAGQLPPGISLAGSGQLSGTPSNEGTFAFTVTLHDQAGKSASQALSLVIAPDPPAGSGAVLPASGVAVTQDAFADYYTFSFPGYAKFKVGDGLGPSVCTTGTTNGCQGVMGFWDLKNDPNAQWDFGAAEDGMFEHQWGFKNKDGSLRYNEVKEGPMPITITEANNVRVVLTLGPAKIRAYGELQEPADCCTTMTKTMVFYRHGRGAASYNGATQAVGASKVYTRTTINYDGSDGLGPLTTAGTNTSINFYNKISWWKISGEFNANSNPCTGLVTFTASPWNVIYQAPGDYRNKDWILFAPAAANSSNVGEYLLPNTCVSPVGAPQGPLPGNIQHCDGASAGGCASQSPSGAVVRTSFLQIAQEQQCGFMNLNSLAPYFTGGLRVYCHLGDATFNANSPLAWTSAGFLGDNGITSEAVADTYRDEYKTPPLLTFTSGTGGNFDPVQGYWAMAASNNNLTFTTPGALHSPAFQISSWTAPVPTTIHVNGSTLTLNTDYVAVLNNGGLLLQILQDLNGGTQVEIP